MSSVDLVAVEAVLDARSECSDRERAGAVLAAALAAARAPARAANGPNGARWTAAVHVVATSPQTRAASARITDDAGTLVAERTVTDRTRGSCLALAQAVGAWAELVLDDEVARTKAPPAAPAPAPSALPSVSSAGSEVSAADADLVAGPEQPSVPTREVGTMLFLRNGAATNGGIFGVSPFVTVGVTPHWLLRPSGLFGTSTSRVPPDQSQSENVTLVGGRLDLCRRLHGNYIDRRALEVDLCAGGDVGYVWSSFQSAVRASAGPSAIVRGQIGSNVALEIRGMAGANLVRAGLGPDAPPYVIAAELGGSVRFR